MTKTITCRICKKDFEVLMNQADYLKWKDGALIQLAMPYLTEDERELLISGICGECFDRMLQ